jgi:iron complex transport system ATP-binding protein
VDALALAARRFPELSAGERQRVALARALAQIWDEQPTLGPRYLLLDEPTSHLDMGHQLGIMEHVHSLSRSGVGVIAVMHDLNLAAQFADDVVLLCGGGVIVSGAPHVAISQDSIQRAYGVRPHVMPHPDTGQPVVIPGASQPAPSV